MQKVKENGIDMHMYKRYVDDSNQIPSVSDDQNTEILVEKLKELCRRIANTSRRLNWEEYVSPVLTEYMRRMKAAGFDENYRKNVLLNALARSDARIRRAEAGEVPLNRSSGYEKVQRRREKKEKKMSWSTKGGYLAPIIIPSTPGGELAKQLREICQK